IALRVGLIPLYAYLPGSSLDEYAWKRWMQAIHEHGVLNVFQTTNTDYVGYHWVLWLLSILYGWIGGGSYAENLPARRAALAFPLHVLLKLPPLIFDALLVVAVYAATT